MPALFVDRRAVGDGLPFFKVSIQDEVVEAAIARVAVMEAYMA